MSYAVEWRPSARKQVRRLNVSSRRRVLAAIDDLSKEPRPVGSVTLTGSRRIRIGSYRVVYEVQDDVLVVLVLRVGSHGGIDQHLDP